MFRQLKAKTKLTNNDLDASLVSLFGLQRASPVSHSSLSQNRRKKTTTMSTSETDDYDDQHNEDSSTDTSLFTSDLSVPYLSSSARNVESGGASVVTHGTDLFFQQLRNSKAQVQGAGKEEGWESASSNSSNGSDDYNFDGNSMYDLEIQSQAMDMDSIGTPDPRKIPLPYSPRHANHGSGNNIKNNSSHHRRRENAARSLSRTPKVRASRREYDSIYRRYKMCLITIIALALAVSVGMVVLLLLNQQQQNQAAAATTVVATTTTTTMEDEIFGPTPPTMAESPVEGIVPVAPEVSNSTDASVPPMLESELDDVDTNNSTVVVGGGVCEDSTTPVLRVDGADRDCAWLALRPAALAVFCAQSEDFRQQCSASCGECE